MRFFELLYLYFVKIISVKDIALTDSEIGGKAKGLMSLHQNNLTVPEFYLLAYNCIESIEKNEIDLDQILEDWKQTNNISESQLWAVRSSAGVEDGSKKSFAGQFKTITNVDYSQIYSSVHEVLKSYKQDTEYTEIAKSHAIIIQRMLMSDFSGVLFSKDPLKPYSNQPIINIIPGLGEKLVSGEFSGLRIEFEDAKPIQSNLTEAVEGESFKDGRLTKVTSLPVDIESAIYPHLKTVLNAVFKLEKINNAPLDIEFAIQNGIFYWLQVRPITTRKLRHDYLVWDNTSVEANYPGTTLPLSISFVQKTFYKAYSGAGKSIGFSHNVLGANKHLLSSMSGGIDGALYYNITAWQSLIYLMPFGKLLSRKLPKLWGMGETPFIPPTKSHSKLQKGIILFNLIRKLIFNGRLDKQYNQIHNNTLESFNNTDLSTLSFNELVDKYQGIESKLGDNWIAPALNGFLYYDFVYLVETQG